MRLPYGISDFETLINEDYHFIDKTPYIELIENSPEPYLFFFRPRKFGKSLLISILNYYYGIEYRDQFDQLFGKTYIGQHKTKKANQYYILRFDFSRIDTTSRENTFKGFLNNVKLAVENFIDTYKSNKITDDQIEKILNHENPAEVLKQFFNYYKDKRIYILIDEYDHFANEIIAFDFTHFSSIVSENGFVRKFYESIKTGTGTGVVQKLFITGVTPITLDSITSGFNIGKNVTTAIDFHEMIGFTEEEVSTIMYPLSEESGLPLKQIMEDMRQWYNGYRFNKFAETKIYNSDMVLYFATEFARAKQYQYPEEMIDVNIASDYTKIAKMFDVKNRKQNFEILDQLLLNDQVISGLTAQFNFNKEYTLENFVSMLFYLGFVSIKGYTLDKLHFSPPNYVIRRLYYEFFLELVKKENHLEFDTMDISPKIFELAQNNNIRPFVALIEEALTALSNRDYIKFDEKYLKVLFVAYLNLSSVYYIKSEPEYEGKYPDILLLFREPFKPNYQFLIELKYLKKSEANQYEKVRKEGLKQVANYLEIPEIKELRELKSYLIIFVGNHAESIEEIKR